MYSFKIRGAFLVLLVATLGPACGGGGGGGSGPVTVTAVLRGSQVVPTTGSGGTGTASLTIAANRQSIDWNTTHTGLTNITYLYVYAGAPGQNGGIILTLFSGALGSPASGTATSLNFSASPADGITTFNHAIAAILSGDANIAITTAGFPNGEIRGQLGAVLLAARSLSAAQQVSPTVVAASTGAALVELNADQTEVTVNVTHTGLTNITMAHIHAGKVGTNGGIILTFPAPLSSPYNRTLTAAQFTASGGDGINTFADAINAILSGNTYINFHTVAHSGGEIRGQVGPVRLTSSLDEANEAPPLPPGTGTGTGDVVLNGLQTSIGVNVTFSGLTGAITAAHIHTGAVGVDGPAVVTLAGAAPSPIVGTFTPISASLVEAMLSGNSYINLHTAAQPDGEVRGQLVAP